MAPCDLEEGLVQGGQALGRAQQPTPGAPTIVKETGYTPDLLSKAQYVLESSNSCQHVFLFLEGGGNGSTGKPWGMWPML